MINIITAIGNPRLNIELNKYNEFYTIGSDIQYKEGILETLESSKDVDFVVINSLLEGQIKIEDLIDEIKNMNNKIKIIIIFEQRNKELENKLIKKGVYDFFYNDTELNHIINVLKNNNIEIINRELRKEIDELKTLINEKNNKNYNKKIKEKIINNKINFRKYNNNENNNRSKIIGISGIDGIGKSSFIYFLSNVLSKKNKILILDLNFKNNNSNLFFNLKKEYIDEEKFVLKNYIKNIKNNLYIFSEFNQIIFDKKIEINYLINEIKNIKNDYNFIFFDINLNTENEKINTIINEIINACDCLFLLTLTDFINTKKTEKLINYLCEKNSKNSEKINLILYKNNIINGIFYKRNIIKNNLINYKIIGKIKIFYFYNFYLLKQKNIHFNLFFKLELNKIFKKLLNN